MLQNTLKVLKTPFTPSHSHRFDVTHHLTSKLMALKHAAILLATNLHLTVDCPLFIIQDV